ncbi:MAG: glucose 1-dehydrogenase [Actinomycetota bacterium]
MPIDDLTERPLADLVSLSGRRAVVTGGARGIGAAICRRLAEAGAAVAVADLDVIAATATAGDLANRYGVTAVGLTVDVGSAESIRALAISAEAALGGIDVWVNNAGIFPTTGPALDAEDDFVDHMLRVNVRGTFNGAKEAARLMTEGGVIVNLASTAAFRAAPGISAYAASKGAVRQLTQNLAVELGPAGIRVLAVAPGPIDTPGVRDQLAPLREAGVDVERSMAMNPLGRGGVPDDIARVVLFCCSDLSMFMTGSTLPVEAGSLA